MMKPSSGAVHICGYAYSEVWKYYAGLKKSPFDMTPITDFGSAFPGAKIVKPSITWPNSQA